MEHYEIYVIIYIHIHIHIYTEKISYKYIYRKQNTSKGEYWKCGSRLAVQRNPVSSTHYLHSRMLICVFPFHPFGTTVNFIQHISIFHKQCDCSTGS